MAGRAQQQQQNFYRPYDSADESGADSDTESSQTFFNFGINQEPAPKGTVDGHPNFKEFASKSQLMDAAGPNLSTLKDQLSYGVDRIGKNTTYSYYEGKPGEEEDPYASTEITTADGTDQTLILIDSRYRDRTAYPQPTLFTLRLPRIYKNITNITLADVKLLTSFYFFRLSKGNTDITVYEKDRTTLTYEGTYQSTIVKRYITTGSYSIDSLQSEIQLQLNYTPLFFDFVNGFGDFITAFRASGDFSINFNLPGDFFYNNTTNLWVPNPTVNTIVTHFWKNRYAGLSNYTVNQLILAYYYPVLNEYLYDENYSNKDLNLTVGLGIDPTITTLPEVNNRILYYFEGINPPDPIVLAVINANKPILDKYRLQHTFRYWLINKYIVSRDTRSQNVYITSPSLNTSLVNLLNQQRQRYFTRALQLYNLTLAQYNAVVIQVDRSLAVLSDMYNYHQTRFLDYFAVPWSQYTLSYYANLNFQIFLRPGLNATDIPANDSEAVSAGIISYSNDVLTQLNSNPPYYWPNMSNLSAGSSTISLVNLSSATSNFQQVYHMSLSNFFPSSYIVDPTTSYIYSDYLTNSANAVCPIESGKYTIFKFHSPVRQTMQVETLPRPTVYRLPKYNQSNFDSNINYYFDLSYAYFFTSNLPYPPTQPATYLMAYDNLPSTNLLQIPGWSPADGVGGSNFGRSYLSSLSSYTSNVTTDVVKFNRSLYMTFTTPDFPGADPNSNYTFSMNLSVQFYTTNTSATTATPSDQFRMFLYHDRGGFEGDVSGNRNESPYFWKFSTVITPQMSTATIQFTSYPKQQYFVSLRADASNFGNVYTRIVPWFSQPIVSTIQTRSIAGINPATDIYLPNFNSLIASNFNYAQVYDSNFIRLPIASTLWTPDPSSNTNNNYLPLNLVPIGYDSNNASTDYTDYIPYSFMSPTFTFYPQSNLGIDPISQYLFQSNSPYDVSTQTFLYADGFNSIFTPGLTATYNPGIVPVRQFKIVHYYSVNYLPESDSNVPLAPGLIGNISTAQLPYTVSTTQGVPIGGYTYGTNSNIQLSRGVLGWNFIPDEGVWDVKRVAFRSAIEDYDNDPNSNIAYLAVYNMGDIISTNTVNLTMSSAYVVLSNSSRVTYNSTFTPETNGFDEKGGTWYEFIKDSSFVAQTYSNVLGYTQVPATMSDQPESMYCVMAFNQFGTPITIKALSGSAVPYPYYSQVFQSNAYFDGTHAYNYDSNIVFPSSIGQTNWPFATSLSSFFGPPPGGSVTQSRYALSLPIGTSVVNFKRGLSPTQDTNYIFPWTTTLTPTKVIASVADYLLLQDTNFNIYDYSLISPTRTFGEPTWTITPDQVFPTYEFTSLVGLAANTTHFYFMGFSNDGGSNVNFALRMKRFDPTTGVLYDYPLDSSFKVPIGGTFKSFTINDAEQIVLSYQQTDNRNYLYRCLLASTTMTSMGSLPVMSTLVHAMDPQASTIYMLPLNGTTRQGNTVYRLDINGTFPGTPYTPTVVGPPGPPSWTGLTVNKASTVPSVNDRIFMYSELNGYQSNVYVTSNWQAPSTFNMVLVSTPVTNLAGVGQAIGGIMNGYNAGLWITATQQPLVWGNRNSDTDIAGIIDSAWQIFYPTQKIVLEKLANQYNVMVDQTYLDYPEYPHTAMFYYQNGNKMSNDISTKWGLESSNNFLVSDTNMSGYYFNSYIYNVPLVASSSINYQYLTVRGYSPTETSETMIRFNLPNKYDFGYATQNDIINEITLLSTIPTLFNSNYGYTLSTFNASYQQSNSFFGGGLLPDFDGSNFNSSNFQQFASNYSTIYAGYQSNAQLINDIENYVNSNLLRYISTNLQYILPPEALGRLNFTDPIVFSLLWKSGLLPQYKNLLEDWGLGYNLGYAKIDTPFSTYARATSFYKILEDYIYLRMNPEYQLNRMDSTSRENLSITRDSTGSIQNFHGKLILNNFNTFSTSFVFNNNPFNPPIGRLDTMYFEWVDFTGLQIDNADCEWTASLVITESKSKASLPVRMKAPQALLPPFMKPYDKAKK